MLNWLVTELFPFIDKRHSHKGKRIIPDLFVFVGSIFINVMFIFHQIHISSIMALVSLLLGILHIVLWSFCKGLKFRSSDKPWGII